MYNKTEYIKRGLKFLNNNIRPTHKKLSTLMIYATDLCDSKCKHCLIWAKRPVKHLPLEKIIEVMQSTCVTRSTKVGLEGGEFLLHPQATEVLAWFHKNHPNFDLLSNCLKPDSLIEAVHKYPPARLYVSLDGDAETYKYMRGKDGYSSVIQVIEACREKVPISLMFTLSPYNSFDDLDHVIAVCKKYDIDVRVGVYNDIAFFDTLEKAHRTDIGAARNLAPVSINEVNKLLEGKGATAVATPETESSVASNGTGNHDFFKSLIPDSVKSTSENYDFLLLYDEWRKANTKIKCYSILDSAVIHPNGDVPICQNLDVKLGNIYDKTLDEVFNSYESCQVQKKHSNSCNGCWINFHRKYDIIMLRTLERFMPKSVVELLYGKYSWCFDEKMSYKEFMKKYEAT